MIFSSFIENRCLRCKLLFITFLICAVAVGSAVAALFAFEVLHFRSGYKRDTAAIAAIAADNSTAALAFGDRKAASETLASLKAIPSITSASLTDAKGTVIAHFGAEEGRDALESYPAPGVFEFRGDSMFYTRPVQLDGANLGRLLLKTDYRRMLFKLVRFYSLTALGILIGSMALALLLTRKLGGIITNPILRLADSARHIGEKHDYSVRSDLGDRRDELGFLARAFNAMLERIQSQDEALNLSRHKLDSLVNSIEGVVWEWDCRTEAFTFVSRQCQDLLGHPCDGRTLEPGFWKLLVHPADTDIPVNAHREAVKLQKSYQCEYRILTANQQIVWIRDSGVALAEEGRTVLLRGIFLDITRQKRAAEELARLNSELVQASRQAGMAEVATGVLHNVGNVLNSVNVSASLIRQNLRSSAVASMKKLKHLLLEHQSDYAGFLTANPKGRAVPDFIIQLTDLLETEHVSLLKEHELLAKYVEHIMEIVAMQQNYARLAGFMESISLPALLDDALQINAAALSSRGINVVKQYTNVPNVTIDKHKVLQILVNLIQNAKHALDGSDPGEKRIEVAVSLNGDNRVKVIVRDNGTGIPPENIKRIFSHGFTTRKGGHGFGLHSGANAAKEMGGLLKVESAGRGQGATFTLELPLTVQEPANSTN